MDLYTPGVALAAAPGPGARIAAPPGPARPGRCLRRRPRHRGGRGQREETRLRQTRMWAHAARRHALWALGSSGAAILLAAVALLIR